MRLYGTLCEIPPGDWILECRVPANASEADCRDAERELREMLDAMGRQDVGVLITKPWYRFFVRQRG